MILAPGERLEISKLKLRHKKFKVVLKQMEE